VRAVAIPLGPLIFEKCRYDVNILTDHLSEKIQSHQPQGPYHLAGYCFGGIVAIGLARKLLAHGHEVATLALIETGLDHSRPINVTRQVLLGITSPGRILRYSLKRIARFSRSSSKAPSSPWEPTLRAYSDAMVRLQNEFVLAPYDGRITLILGNRSRFRFFASDGWKTIARQGVAVHVISGDHQSSVLLERGGLAQKLFEIVLNC
jgi:thioesterase domain-containing protein